MKLTFNQRRILDYMNLKKIEFISFYEGPATKGKGYHFPNFGHPFEPDGRSVEGMIKKDMFTHLGNNDYQLKKEFQK